MEEHGDRERYECLLSERIGGEEVKCYADVLDRDVLLAMVGEGEGRAYDNAAWVLTHLSADCDGWLQEKQKVIIEKALRAPSVTQHRLLLTLLLRTEFVEGEIDGRFVDHLLDVAADVGRTAGVRSAAMKLAYACCRHYDELVEELEAVLTLAAERSEGSAGSDTKAVLHTRNKILKLCKRRR